MKIFPLALIFIASSAFAQSPGNSQRREPVDAQQEQAFEQWDRQERKARQRAERLRLLNEERAREMEPVLQKQQEKIEVECKCPPIQKSQQ